MKGLIIMIERTELEDQLDKLSNKFRFTGIGLITISALAFLFTTHEHIWPLDAFTLTLSILATVGSTAFLCGQLAVRKLVGFGSMEPPQVSIPPSEK